MATASDITFADVLHDLFAVDAPAMPQPVAQWALSLRLSERQRERMLELVDLGNRGKLSGTERREMESYRDAGNLLSLLHAKARLSLHQSVESD